MNSKITPDIKDILEELVNQLKEYSYPKVELADIISLKIMIDYILSNQELTKSYKSFVRKCILLIDDILGDKVYFRIEEKLITLESEFRDTIIINKKQFSDKIIEEIKDLMAE